jgi:RHS repeat-associated protein
MKGTGVKMIRPLLLTIVTTLTLATQTFAVGYWGRTYDPNLQCWIHRDPIGEQGGINLFQFVGNNPINLVDPYGLEAGFTYHMDGRMTIGDNVPLGTTTDYLMVGTLAGLLTGGTADALLAGGGFLSGGSLISSVTVGSIGGLGADAGIQGTKIALGNQSDFNFGELGFSGLTGGGFGAGGYALGKLAPLLSKCPPKVPVSRWGRPGLKPGDWVMEGPKSPLNYLASGKYQWPWVPTFGQSANIPASYMSGVTYNVSPSSLSWPSGLLGAVKAAMGQRIYTP